MATTVGTGDDLKTVLRDFIYLERDAIAAYDASIPRLDDAGHKAKIEAFKADHERHLQELISAQTKLGGEVPHDTDSKSVLTTGKVALAGIAGESAVLKAMASNEVDTITAYENGARNGTVPADLRPMMERALADEQRHKAWMDEAAKAA